MSSGPQEHVMVPVPEELVGDVLNYLRWNVGTKSSKDWDLEAVAQLIADLDEPARRLLVFVADAAADATVVTLDDVATAAGCTDREALGLVVELNDAVTSAGGPPFVMANAPLYESTETGPASWSINMVETVAVFILNAAGRGVRVRDD